MMILKKILNDDTKTVQKRLHNDGTKKVPQLWY